MSALGDFEVADPGEASAAITAEQAFDEAHRGFAFGDRPLRPYTRTRVVAAQSMGLRYPYIGEEGTEKMAATGLYPGALKDTVIVLWLCLTPNASEATVAELKASPWTVQAADRKPHAAYEQALAWAEESGILDLASAPFAEAYAAFSRIVGGQEASRFTPTGEPGSKEAADPKLSCGPPKGPNTP